MLSEGEISPINQKARDRPLMPKAKPHKINRKFLETLEGYVEAARVRTLDEFFSQHRNGEKIAAAER